MASTLRDKVIAAFKGFIRSYRLLPVKERKLIEDSDYIRSWQMFASDSETALLELVYERQAYHRLIDLVGRLFPGQTDRKFVSRSLKQTAKEWIEQGHSPDDQTLLEQAATGFLEKVERGIRSFTAYIPVEGIEIHSRECLQLARCQLCRNDPDSDLMTAVRQERERFSWESEQFDEDYSSVTLAPAFFRVKVTGHSGRATQSSREEVNLALNVLRLFLGSFYVDIHTRPSNPRHMGIAGTLPAIGPHSNVFLAQAGIPIEEQFPGSSVQYMHRDPHKLSHRNAEILQSNSILARINRLLCSLETGKGTDVARRLLRAVNWFGKASTASSIAESFLMYAISIESLLSEGRTPKETYAKRMAALVTRHDDQKIYPWDGHLSSEFAEKLRDAACRDDRFSVVDDKVVELFDYRNDIAHGRVLEDEIEAVSLLDLETLVRNSVLSFVDGGWDTLDQFKEWLDCQYPPTAAHCAIVRVVRRIVAFAGDPLVRTSSETQRGN